ncbi:MAG: aspartate carbamoyltransferase [Candidatus Andersenbacteria bacterium RIFCSPHIGHO2_12_FULL_45_11b]|uniref:Aspartate carbamoyltransferase n=1 Tax=Candidatus Andersenbacteria bacterium RIFCSPHIGHO2_12_FULL_45_11b TaxID=1797282 RepID=A0A1G1XBN9_9BACT|nr:MAG: aspartate carbamoyltransferase [Candidatus Andersenbacteria bacterium RIFCSPHIGHO2_12_FULL_45_11b]
MHIALPENHLKHIVSTDQFTDLHLLKQLFQATDRLRRMPDVERLELLRHKLLATIFYEPSTRTRLSFETAMYRMGGQVISSENADISSSTTKGETIEDTIRTLGTYADIIVLRHPEQGTAEKAAKASLIPVINAGDGAGEHPTQALLDLYTLLRHLGGSLNGKTIALVGDLLYGRTVHSLVKLLTLYENVRIILVSPPQLRMPPAYKHIGVTWEEVDNLTAVKEQVDALYVTRIQKERFQNQATYKKLQQNYVINKKTLKVLKSDGVIMHPLPRVGEIATEVDADPRAMYFEQIQNGIFVRMALLYWLLANKP